MKKNITLILFSMFALFSINTFAQCITATNTYNNLATAGGAPCTDSTGCSPTDAGFSGFGIYASEGYLLPDVQSGYDYVFSMCTGFGAGAWVPAISIVAPSGAVDAFNLGTTGTFAANCSIAWTATESGIYTIVIHEQGTTCGTTNTIDNGNPIVSCGTNAASCTPPPPCVAGGLSTTGFPLSICPGDSFTLISDTFASTPGGFGIFFSPQATGAGGLGGAFTLTGVSYPYSGDNDLFGTLSNNGFPVLTGEYAIFLVSYSDIADPTNTICATSTDSVIVDFLTSGSTGCAPPPACDNGDVDATLANTIQNICPGDSLSLGTDGNEVVNTGETYGWFFQSNTMVDSTYIIFGPTTYFGDLNAALVSAGADPIPFDSYTVSGFVTDSAQTVICGGILTVNNFTINLLDATDPLCAGTPPGTPCTTSATGPFTDINTAGGAPCDDGTGCTPTAVTFGAWASEAYLLDNVQAGFDYVFDICSGASAGSWMPAITIQAPSGAVDAFNLGTTGTFAMNCTQSWTATESGTYIIYIHEAGTTCLDSNTIDNGIPTVSCGTTPATCLPCTAGVLSSPSSMTVCSNDIDSIVLDGTESTPGSYSLSFDDTPGGTGGLAGGFNIAGISSFPFVFDNDLNGILSFNSLPVLSGMWDVTIYNVDALGAFCDSVSTTISINFLDSTNTLCGPTSNCDITALTAGTQTACNSANNTYSQDIIVTFTDAPTTGMLVVNGQSFALGTSPQTVTLTNLNSDGLAVDVMATFSADTSCSFSSNSLFTAPADCSCSISDLSAGAQTACVNTTNEYTQEVIVTFANAPTTGMLTVNGQNFSIGTSPQTVVLTGLTSDGAAVNVSSSFTAQTSCDYSENAVFTAPASCLCPTITVGVSTTNVTNCASPNGTATATPSGGSGGYTFAWTPSSFGTGATISNVPSGTYTVIATDMNGCSGTGTGSVSNTTGVNANVGSFSMVDCFNGNNGAISINASGGTGTITYTWSDLTFSSAISSRNDLVAGNYTVTVTDGGGCSVVLGPIMITQPDQLVATVDNSTNVTCNNVNDGTINVTTTGGNGGNTYSWTNGGGSNEDATSLAGGVYQLTVTDNNSCTATSSAVTISNPSVISISVDNQNDVSCNGANDGNILVTATGGTGALNYNWDNAPNNEDVLNTGGGTYQLTVTDANNCSTQSSVITLDEPDALVVSIDNSSDVSCFQANDGSITASVTGGTGTMNIMWTNGGGTSLSPNNLAPNSYQLTVTDGNSCTTTSSIVTITEPVALSASISSTTTSPTANTGTATVVASGGTAPYSYLWSDASAQTTSAATGLAAGAYSCVITDVNGCTYTVQTEVSTASSIGTIAIESLSIYPNPSNGSFIVSFETIENLDFDIKVINTIGKTVYSNSFDKVNGEFSKSINLDNVSNGIYFIEISNEDAKSINRITINK